jgi:hypothetical protein
MALLNDIKGLIKPINFISYDNFYKSMDNILENLIVHNNTSYNSFIFNHIIYNNSTIDNKLKDNVIDCIKRHLSSNIKNQRIHFRNLNKKNKLNVSDFNLYFDNIYKLICKLNGMFQHIIPNNSNKKNGLNGINGINKWGISILWDYAINTINNVLINDIIFRYSINNNINNNIDSKNPDISRLNYYINIFIEYISTDNKNIFYSNFVEHIDNALIDNIELKKCMLISSIRLANSDINENIINITVFNKLYKYYMDCYSNYYYISKNNPFNKLKQYITEHIIKIFETDDIVFIKNFMNTYKKEFISLIKHIDITNILLNCCPTDINNYISYNNTLCEIAENNVLSSVVLSCIKNNIDKYFNNFENILYLADLINTDIINKKINKFYYLLGSFIKNKDEFITAICQKLMERIIYTNIDMIIEGQHKEVLENTFSVDIQLLLKYNIILKDYIESQKYCYDNKKLLITSLETWKINHSTGYSNTIINTEEFTTLLCNHIFKFNQHNINLNIKKKLIYYPHLGSVEIEIYNQKIIVLPAHMFCLELFVSFDTNLPFNVIFDRVKMNMSNYSDDFIKSIINSLIGPILIKTKEEQYRIKTDFNNNSSIINMIDIFHQMNNTKRTIINKIKEELSHEKEHIIMANINHYIKKFEQISMIDLHDLLEANIKLFEVDLDLFVKTVFKMKEKELLEVNDNKIKKIVYTE